MENTGREVLLSFGRTVRQLREAHEWTQEQLANRMSTAGYPMHQVTVGKLETGRRPTSVGEVVALAAIFEVDPGELIRFPSAGDGDDAAMARMRAQQELRELDHRIDRMNVELDLLQERRAEAAAQLARAEAAEARSVRPAG
ncbi:helix-turn-helix domain-containing protein [Jiangella anatolica]|uniref:helix-turn-helix domain-containing protein n=1 Tax=Jiangella anatolica TaxID=2670374 RepID=UPI001314B057|nr:helix-turn-helix transcriptional regulator [Jiangella anatolica]